jgi:hypothetical protein
MYGLLNESVSSSPCVGRNNYAEGYSVETSRKRPLGRTRIKWQDNSGMNLRVVEYESTEWIDLVQNSDKKYGVLNKAISRRVPLELKYFD